jgi:hypothetical protein
MTGSLIRSLPLCVLALACTDPASSDETEAPAADARVLATFDTVDGAHITFIDESEGGGTAIGIEIASATTTPATDRALAEDPTALELYLALSPIAKPPQVLVDDHAATRGGEPRRLVIAMGTAEDVDAYDCDDVTTWEGAFETWAPDLDGAYLSGSWETGQFSGFLSYSPTFYLDVCRPSNTVSIANAGYYVVAQRRINAGAAWSAVSTQVDALDLQQRRWRYRRTSNTCSSFQHRLFVDPAMNGRYRVAARYADPWGCQIAP